MKIINKYKQYPNIRETNRIETQPNFYKLITTYYCLGDNRIKEIITKYTKELYKEYKDLGDIEKT